MGATFIVTLREAFEAALVLGIIYSYLEKVGARDGVRYLTRGGLPARVASVAMGLGVSSLSGPLLDIGPDLITLVVIFAAVGLLTWHAWWMQQHARLVKGQVQHRIAEEGGGWGSRVGGGAGIVGAAALGWAVFRGGQRLSLQRFFSVTTVFIMLLAAGLFSRGIGRMQGMGLLRFSEPVWNTSWLLSDGSVAGGFLSGLVGYRAQPTLPEVCAYGAYIVIVGLILFARRAPAAVGLVRPS